MLQRLFLFLLLFQVLPDIFLYFRFVVRKTAKQSLKVLYWLPTVLLIAGLLYLVFWGGNDFSERHTQAIGWFSFVYFLFTSPKLLLATLTAIGLAGRRFFRLSPKPFVGIGLFLAGLNAAMIIYGCFIGRSRLETKEVSFTSTQLPSAFDGYRIVQLSDFHIGSWVGHDQTIRTIVEQVNAMNPDLIVFTGDLVNHRALELEGFQEILSRLKAKDGVYSVLGNHDYGPYFHWKNAAEQEANLKDLERRQAAMGWQLLNNTHVFLTARNSTVDSLKEASSTEVAKVDSVALIGVENEGEPPFSQHGDLPRAMAGTEGMFQILLSHNPTHWKREVLPDSDIELMLAGHTHGMQFRIGNFSPAQFVYPQWSGLYLDDTASKGLYVNVGIGYVGLPFRFGSWPEITVLTLHKQPQQKVAITETADTKIAIIKDEDCHKAN